ARAELSLRCGEVAGPDLEGTRRKGENGQRFLVAQLGEDRPSLVQELPSGVLLSLKRNQRAEYAARPALELAAIWMLLEDVPRLRDALRHGCAPEDDRTKDEAEDLALDAR